MMRNNIPRYAVGAATASVSIIVLAACGSSGGSSGSAAAGGAASGSTNGLRTQSTSIGTVAADKSGHTLYELVGDTAAKSKCTGSCLAIWPAAKAGGSQVVLQGHPAYTYSGDSAAGQVNGQGVKDQWGTWYALDSNGAPITKAPSSGAASSSSGGSGGYGY
jgi:predicted lipoprotein with Yx(FWY)xxD motif